MSFFKIARNAAAAEYGRVRAEQYGRRAKGLSALGLLAAFLMVLAIIAAAKGAFGG